MKRDFNVVVKDFEGRPHVRPLYRYDDAGMPLMEGGRQVFDRHVPMTLATYALDALAGRWRGEESLSNEDMWKRMKLHDKIATAVAMPGPIELTSDEGKILMDALNHQGAAALVIGRMKDLLDTDPAPAAE